MFFAVIVDAAASVFAVTNSVRHKPTFFAPFLDHSSVDVDEISDFLSVHVLILHKNASFKIDINPERGYTSKKSKDKAPCGFNIKNIQQL